MNEREVATGLHSLQRWLQPAATRLVNIAAAAGLNPHVSSARRSHAQQALLYRRFLAGQSRFPAAPPGFSTHELGLAFDLWVNDESQLSDLGKVWEQMGGTWGGHFKDPIHFEAGGVQTRAGGRRASPVALAKKQGVSPLTHTIAEAADVLLGFIPFVGTAIDATELSASLLRLGFPQSEVLKFLSGPISYVF